MYDARFTKRFNKQFRKLDRQIQREILKEIENVKEHPDIGEPLKGILSDFLKVRVKDYRVVYQLHSSQNIIEFVFVDHRAHVYEELSRLRREEVI
jgi:addiction module RelE/StbE family toxin